MTVLQQIWSTCKPLQRSSVHYISGRIHGDTNVPVKKKKKPSVISIWWNLNKELLWQIISLLGLLIIKLNSLHHTATCGLRTPWHHSYSASWRMCVLDFHLIRHILLNLIVQSLMLSTQQYLTCWNYLQAPSQHFSANKIYYIYCYCSLGFGSQGKVAISFVI